MPTEQVSASVCSRLKPPKMRAPRGSRALKPSSKPLYLALDVRIAGVDVLHCGAELRLDVVHGDHAAIHRADHVDRNVAVVGARDVVALGDVGEAVVVPLAGHGEAVPELLGDAEVERVLAGPLDVRVGRGQRAGAEGRGQVGEIDLAAGRQVGAATLALGDVVAVDVGPRQVLGGQGRRRVEPREPGGLRGHEPVEAGADRRLAGAEDVPDDRGARREVAPRRHLEVVVGRHVGEAPGLGLLADDALRHAVVANAVVEGEVPPPPRVLHVGGQLAVHVLLDLERGVQHRHLGRHAAGVGLVEVAVGVVVAAILAPAVEQADLHVVRAGDVGHRRRHRVPVGKVAQLGRRGVPQEAGAEVVLADVLVPRRGVALGENTGLVEVVVALHVVGGAGLEQDLRRQRRGPLGRPGREDWRVPHHRGRRRVGVVGHRRGPQAQGAVVVDGQLVLLGYLPGEPRDRVVHLLGGLTLLAGAGLETGREGHRRSGAGRQVVGVGHELVVVGAAVGAEEPHLVAQDRTAELGVHLHEVRDAVDRPDVVGLELVGQVVALPRRRALGELEAAGEAVAAVLGHQVEVDAGGHRLGVAARGHVDRFLRHRLVVVGVDRAVAHQAVGHQAVDHDHGLRRAGAADEEVGLLHGARAAHVGLVEGHAGDQLAEALDGAGGRHGVEHVAGQHLLLDVALHVDQRRLPGDGDRFLQRADLEVGVDGGDEVRRQLEFADDDVEALQRERELVVTRAQIDHPIGAVLVGDRGPNLLDQRFAGRFHHHSGHHRTGFVLHDTADGTLRVRRRRPETGPRERNAESQR